MEKEELDAFKKEYESVEFLDTIAYAFIWKATIKLYISQSSLRLAEKL